MNELPGGIARVLAEQQDLTAQRNGLYGLVNSDHKRLEAGATRTDPVNWR